MAAEAIGIEQLITAEYRLRDILCTRLKNREAGVDRPIMYPFAGTPGEDVGPAIVEVAKEMDGHDG